MSESNQKAEGLETRKPDKLLGAIVVWGFAFGFVMFFVITLYLLKHHGELFSSKSDSDFYLHRFPYMLAMLSGLILFLTSKKILKAYEEERWVHKATWLGIAYVLASMTSASGGWLVARGLVMVFGIWQIG